MVQLHLPGIGGHDSVCCRVRDWLGSEYFLFRSHPPKHSEASLMRLVAHARNVRSGKGAPVLNDSELNQLIMAFIEGRHPEAVGTDEATALVRWAEKVMIDAASLQLIWSGKVKVANIGPDGPELVKAPQKQEHV